MNEQFLLLHHKESPHMAQVCSFMQQNSFWAHALNQVLFLVWDVVQNMFPQNLHSTKGKRQDTMKLVSKIFYLGGHRHGKRRCIGEGWVGELVWDWGQERGGGVSWAPLGGCLCTLVPTWKNTAGKMERPQEGKGEGLRSPETHGIGKEFEAGSDAVFRMRGWSRQEGAGWGGLRC